MLSKFPLHIKPTLNIGGLEKFEYICSLVHGGTRKGNNITPTVICYLSFHVPSDCLAQPQIPKQFSSVQHSRVLEAFGLLLVLNESISCLIAVLFYVMCICLIFFNQLEQFTFLMITNESLMSLVSIDE